MYSPGVTFHSIFLPHCSTLTSPLRTRQRAGQPFLRQQAVRVHVCLCPPGSVTGICPCRVKVCRARLVTAPRCQLSSKHYVHNHILIAGLKYCPLSSAFVLFSKKTAVVMSKVFRDERM
ncbi:hypothetical protein JOB18_020449 [Solea senegalensis]|uniref:Uncharacterized protein n=1 Tax=Solea senegalensis TaxID=28829 RepID=A0AAV6SIF0_SOLSE|nr:hypothetical protein JOB18_020449 [Solea senegalensis]